MSNEPIALETARRPRVLMFSQRNIFPNALFRCPLYEFEDLICDLDAVDLVAPQMNAAGRRHVFARKVKFHADIRIDPGVQAVRFDKDYELFLAICGAPGDLLAIDALPDWKGHCRTSICLMDEIWVKQLHDFRHFLKILKRFDVVVMYYSQTAKPLSEILDRPCVFMPPGVDVLRFSPYPDLPRRVVDVYSIGRRASVTHDTLMRMVDDEGIFYVYDTFAGDQALKSADHRKLFANVARRSRYFIVNPGLIDRPDKRGDQIEVSNRYFEGSAAGTVMIGERPTNEAFKELFDWPDAVIQMSFNSPKIGEMIRELDGQPERVDRIRRTNVAQAMLRHDWAYRWESMLKVAGLEPLPALTARQQRLKYLADTVHTTAFVA